ncbi:MAG: glycyl-radical enzyme activating protein [Lachnotalea sp.]
MNHPLVTDIQKYSIHDGTGIRTTIFFKGCPLSCTWCHNPETKEFSSQLLVNSERCTGCGNCVDACCSKAISIKNKIAVTDYQACLKCGTCTDYCLQNIREISGKYYSVNDLIIEIEKDKVFYEQSNGGVTLSGGEVLAQNIEYIEKLLVKLHDKGYRVNVDTSGYVPFSIIKRVLPYIDTFLFDIKIMNPVLHKKYTGVDNALILENLKQLSREKASIWIRIPIIGGVNNTVSNIEEIATFIKKEQITIKQINLLPYHNTGSGKYKRLNGEYMGKDFITPTLEELNHYVSIFQKYGFYDTKIGG